GSTFGFGGDGGPATAAKLNQPFGLACDAAGNLYIADNQNSRIRMVNTSGIINTVAGSNSGGFAGDGGMATAAKLNQPYGVGFDAVGNMYIADNQNHRIRLVTTSGIISTVAGNGGFGGFSGDGGQATAAALYAPSGVACDATGNVYIADTDNYRIRMVSKSLTVTINSPTICAGATTTLTASGASTYSWNTSATTASISDSPTTT